MKILKERFDKEDPIGKLVLIAELIGAVALAAFILAFLIHIYR